MRYHIFVLCMLPTLCNAIRPCRLCCENSGSCVYASKASNYENVSHTCCGSSYGKHYCCPDSVENVSFACRGTTGKCKVVYEKADGRSWIVSIMCVWFVCFVFAPSARRPVAPDNLPEPTPVTPSGSISPDDDIDADWG